MKEQPAIPVIQHSDLPGITVCRGCGSEENVQAYALRVGDNERYVIGWCNRCARTVATFLLKPEKGTIQKAIDSLKTLLTERGYEMEIEETPIYSPPFTWIFAVNGNERIPLCSTESHYVKSGYENLPAFLDKQLSKV